MGQITNHFRCAVLLLLIFLPWQVHSQLNNFPYAQSFEGNFVLGDSVQFLPHWWANEAAEDRRIFQDFSYPYAGAATLGLQPISSFQPRVRLYFNGQGLKDAIISFYAAHRKNGSGSRPVAVVYRFSADSGQSWTEEQLLDDENAFPNEDGDYRFYELPVPESILQAETAVFELHLSRGEGSGSTALLLMDEFLVEDGSDRLSLLKAEALSARAINLSFSQAIDIASLQTGNFSLLPEVGINTVELGNTAEQVELQLSADLQAGQPYELSVQNLVSQEGNELKEASISLVYAPVPAFRSVVINEIFADPNPKGQLPEQPVLPTDSRAEFVEILNQSGTAWPLENFSLNDRALAEGQLEAGELLILCHPDFAAAYAAYGKVQAVEGWKTLNNTEGTVRLSYEGTIIDSVRYNANWHEAEKASGGWSLTQLKPDLACSLPENWRSSTNPKGASPGEENERVGGLPDKQKAKLEHAFLLGDSSLLLQFSSPVSSLQPENLALTPEAGLSQFWPIDGSQKSWLISLFNPNGSIPKQLELKGTIADCSGRIIKAEQPIAIVHLSAAESGELKLSEVMYDPGPEGEEYIELHNSTNRWLLADGWALERANTKSVLPAFSIFPPSGYVAYADEPEESTFSARLNAFAIPTLPNSGDTLWLLNAAGEKEEMLVYSDALHHLLLGQSQGTALERLCFALPAKEAGNWSGAASYGSPGLPNSQHCPDSLRQKQRFWAEPALVFPEMAAQHPEAKLHYRLGKLPASGNLRIYTTEGLLVGELLNNALLAAEGSISWNGRDQEGATLPMGYYIAVLRLTYADGQGELLRCSLVVGENMK